MLAERPTSSTAATSATLITAYTATAVYAVLLAIAVYAVLLATAVYVVSIATSPPGNRNSGPTLMQVVLIYACCNPDALECDLACVVRFQCRAGEAPLSKIDSNPETSVKKQTRHQTDGHFSTGNSFNHALHCTPHWEFGNRVHDYRTRSRAVCSSQWIYGACSRLQLPMPIGYT